MPFRLKFVRKLPYSCALLQIDLRSSGENNVSEIIKEHLNSGIEPVFLLSNVAVSSIKVQGVPIPNMEEDPDLTKQNLFASVGFREGRDIDALKEFLERLQVIFEGTWYSQVIEGRFINLKILDFTQAFKNIQGTMTSVDLRDFCKTDTDTNQNLNLIMVRAYDLVSETWYWGIHQISLK